MVYFQHIYATHAVDKLPVQTSKVKRNAPKSRTIDRFLLKEPAIRTR